jgi:hydrogenase nickel incorporation protein HypB
MTSELKVEKKVSALNDELAAKTSELLNKQQIYSINIMGAPGSGKTTLIEGLAKHLGAEALAVIQGDLESDIDTRRLEAIGIHTYQINTHSGCHLNAKLVHEALTQLNFSRKKFLLIENVGNLVCPAGKKIGQDLNMLVSSTTEGSDKPKKYPIIFHESQVVVISKSDLAEAVGFDRQAYLKDLKGINNQLMIYEVSSKSPSSFAAVAELMTKLRDGHHWS